MKIFNLIGVAVIAMFIIVPAVVVYDIVDLRSHHCEETGIQRLANGANGVYVENQYKCDGGKIKWSY